MSGIEFDERAQVVCGSAPLHSIPWPETVQQAAATASASQLATNSAAKMDALRLNLGQARLP